MQILVLYLLLTNQMLRVSQTSLTSQTSQTSLTNLINQKAPTDQTNQNNQEQKKLNKETKESLKQEKSRAQILDDQNSALRRQVGSIGDVDDMFRQVDRNKGGLDELTKLIGYIPYEPIVKQSIQSAVTNKKQKIEKVYIWF